MLQDNPLGAHQKIVYALSAVGTDLGMGAYSGFYSKLAKMLWPAS